MGIDRLIEWLARKLPMPVAGIQIEQFPGGHSNLTYLVRAGERELVVRRPPFGTTVISAHDMGREFTVLSKLHGAYRPAPKPILFCDDESILGVRFYAMERIPGVIYRVRKPEGWALPPDRVRAACLSFIENLAALHAIDYRAVGLESLYKGPGYLKRQIEGWSRRWDAAKTDDLAEMREVRAWLESALPEDAGASLIHNDYKFDNIVYDASSMCDVVGVLDWEMATVGDPLSDFAVTLIGWYPPDPNARSTVSQSFILGEPGALTHAELIEAYRKFSGRDLSSLPFYCALALYKGAVMIQQIYLRYHKGLTQDPRFAAMPAVVRSLAQRARETTRA